MTDIQKMIEEEAEKHAENLHPLDKQKMVLHGKYYWKYHFKAGFNAGANFILSKRPEILFDFFIWFRENGEKYIDMSVEKMIEIYIKDRNDGK